MVCKGETEMRPGPQGAKLNAELWFMISRDICQKNTKLKINVYPYCFYPKVKNYRVSRKNYNLLG